MQQTRLALAKHIFNITPGVHFPFLLVCLLVHMQLRLKSLFTTSVHLFSVSPCPYLTTMFTTCLTGTMSYIKSKGKVVPVL
jgi:hypothetical protein